MEFYFRETNYEIDCQSNLLIQGFFILNPLQATKISVKRNPHTLRAGPEQRASGNA